MQERAVALNLRLFTIKHRTFGQTKEIYEDRNIIDRLVDLDDKHEKRDANPCWKCRSKN